MVSQVGTKEDYKKKVKEALRKSVSVGIICLDKEGDLQEDNSRHKEVENYIKNVERENPSTRIILTQVSEFLPTVDFVDIIREMKNKGYEVIIVA